MWWRTNDISSSDEDDISILSKVITIGKRGDNEGSIYKRKVEKNQSKDAFTSGKGAVIEGAAEADEFCLHCDDPH
jgi:hypothetical protein